MTVAELIAFLQQYPPDMRVVAYTRPFDEGDASEKIRLRRTSLVVESAYALKVGEVTDIPGSTDKLVPVLEITGDRDA